MEGYEFRGMGCCMNSDGDVYGYDTIYEIETIEQCAAACKETYSSDVYFVGINYHPGWGGGPNCNCMKDKTWSGDPAGNGKITDAGGWCHEEYCYSYDDVRFALGVHLKLRYPRKRLKLLLSIVNYYRKGCSSHQRISREEQIRCNSISVPPSPQTNH